MFYEPVQNERFFEKDRLYSAISWLQLDDIVTAWERRIRGWYIEPIEILLNRDLKGWRRRIVQCISKSDNPAHFAFTVMAMTCLLIDALSQYRLGKHASEVTHFRDFVKQFLPSYRGAPPTNPWHYDHKFSVAGKEMKEYADDLWSGYRCGILHQAHAPLYCGIVPGTAAPKVEPINHAKYGLSATNPSSAVGSDWPVVIVCPEHLFDEVLTFFTGYLKDLTAPGPKHDLPAGVRSLFKIKFADSFGVDILSAKI